MSAPRLRKFVTRAPRYVLRPQDRQVMRFSLERTSNDGGIDSTILYNLSETGIAFLIEPQIQIRLGDLIKVEIPIPDGEQIAWWARVVRAEEYEPRTWFFNNDPFKEQNKILIGCKFEDLPEKHSLAIRQGIERSFIKAMRDQQYRNWFYYRAFVLQNIWKFTLYVLLTVASIGFLYYLSRPGENYDGERGAPWGQRYKFF